MAKLLNSLQVCFVRVWQKNYLIHLIYKFKKLNKELQNILKIFFLPEAKPEPLIKLDFMSFEVIFVQ